MADGLLQVSEREDSGLLARVATGDEQAVEQFYLEHADAVFKFAYTKVGRDYEDAQEITQETFLAAIKLVGSFERSCSTFTWLCSLARVRIADMHRTAGRQKRVPVSSTRSFDAGSFESEHLADAQESIDDAVIDRIAAERLVDSLLAELNEQEREALVLRYVDELSVKEIAHVVGRTEKAVDNLLNRAKIKARRNRSWPGTKGQEELDE